MDLRRHRNLVKSIKIGSQFYILYIAMLYFSNGQKEMPLLWLDLTHPFTNETVYFPGMTNFTLDINHRGNTSNGIWFETNSISLGEHGGTHCDAPSHFGEGKLRMHEIPVDRFHGHAFVVDISDKAEAGPDAQMTIEDVIKFEKIHGKIPEKAFLFMYSGWDKKWPKLREVLGNKENYSELHFPGIHPEVAYWLVSQRNISAIGVDTPSLDYGPSTLFEAHRIFYKENLFGMENVNNLGSLPPTGSVVYAFPMNIHDGSGAPCRIIAALPEPIVNSLNSWVYFIIFIVSVMLVLSL